VAEAGQENIETVHEPKPIQAVDTLWGQGRRAMKDLHGPQTQVVEGAYAIKVSMSCLDHRAGYLNPLHARTDHLLLFVIYLRLFLRDVHLVLALLLLGLLKGIDIPDRRIRGNRNVEAVHQLALIITLNFSSAYRVRLLPVPIAVSFS